MIGDLSHPDSGFLSYGRQFTGSYRVKDLPAGRERFDRDRIAPLCKAYLLTYLGPSGRDRTGGDEPG